MSKIIFTFSFHLRLLLLEGYEKVSLHTFYFSYKYFCAFFAFLFRKIVSISQKSKGPLRESALDSLVSLFKGWNDDGGSVNKNGVDNFLQA